MNEIKIKKLQNIVKENLIPIIDDDYVLLDVPNHCNIGDNLIWEGEKVFLNENIPHKCIYEANVINWEEERIKESNIILFHGGGNWGDLYRECQILRNYIVSKYPEKKIIIFPQTVWYNDKSLIESDCKIYENHPNVVICVRDQMSYDTLIQYISKDKVRLLPDMAFFVSVPSEISEGRSLFMMRTDSEINREDVNIIPNCDVKDWPTFSNNRLIASFQLRYMKFKQKFSLLLQSNVLTKKMVDPAYGLNKKDSRKKYVKMGIQFFKKYDTIYTTRLHGLILGILMGRKVCIVDNKYNKCSNFYYTWLEDFDNVTTL